MNIHIVTPYFKQPRGNSVTTRRIKRALEHAGAHVQITALDDGTRPLVPQNFDIIHGFHAYRVYAYLRDTGLLHAPFVISLTGTDINHDIHDPMRSKAVRDCLARAGAIHVFSELDHQRLTQLLPELAGKIYSIAQGVEALPTANVLPVRQKLANERVILLPAGIRKVKNIRLAVDACKKLHKINPLVRLWVVGTVIEQDEWAWLMSELRAENEWLCYLGEVAHEQMGSVYAQADLVINTSISEGQPIAILESMAQGVPVLVSDIPGNRSIVSHRETGLVFRSETDFIDLAGQLLDSPSLRDTMVNRAKQFIHIHHDISDEAQAFLRMYRRIIEAKDS